MARKGEAEGNVPSTRLRCFAATEGARCNHVGFASSSLLPPPHGAAAPSTTGGASSHSNSDQPDNSQQTTVSHAHSCGLEGSPSIKGIVLPIGATSVSASTHTRGTVRRGACGCRKWTGRRGLPATDTHKEISAEAIDFIRCCLRINPAERSTMKELCDTPWLKMARQREVKGGAPN
uniref:Uncharacterized protein TCIL3000_10_13100 n=1 Tax=Trypanosoma congolense (strain IL3000) TaxID=1068625 RepID=G0UYR0_TRYCI|nr:unnamed protein product [Trypanosoma congolense IL3000]